MPFTHKPSKRDMLGHTTTRVTEGHYEFTLPEDAMRGMRLLLQVQCLHLRIGGAFF
jgi:hypothetical protein